MKSSEIRLVRAKLYTGRTKGNFKVGQIRISWENVETPAVPPTIEENFSSFQSAEHLLSVRGFTKFAKMFENGELVYLYEL